MIVNKCNNESVEIQITKESKSVLLKYYCFFIFRIFSILVNVLVILLVIFFSFNDLSIYSVKLDLMEEMQLWQQADI